MLEDAETLAEEMISGEHGIWRDQSRGGPEGTLS